MLTPEWVLRKNKYHMLGIEPYIIGAMRNHDRGMILDLGIGLGYWGFITRTYAAMEMKSSPVLVGVDSEESVLRTHRGMGIYTVLVRGDINNLPFKAGIFDTVLAIESLFEYISQDTIEAIERLAKTEGMLIFSGFLGRSNVKQLLDRGYEVYRVGLWGLLLQNVRDGKRQYVDKGLRRFSLFIRFLARFLHPGQEDYVIALRPPRSGPRV